MTICTRTAALLAVGVFCAPAAGQQADKKKAEWPVIERSADGFAISIPPDWKAVPLDAKSLDKTIEAVTKDNPGLGDMAASIRRQAMQGIKFLGYSPEFVRTGKGTNVNVGKFPNQGLSRKQIVEVNLSGLKQVFGLAEVPKSEQRKVNNVEFDRARFDMSVKGSDGKPIDMTMLMYFHVADADFYVITFVTGREKFEKLADTAEKICDSFRPVMK